MPQVFRARIVRPTLQTHSPDPFLDLQSAKPTPPTETFIWVKPPVLKKVSNSRKNEIYFQETSKCAPFGWIRHKSGSKKSSIGLNWIDDRLSDDL